MMYLAHKFERFVSMRFNASLLMVTYFFRVHFTPGFETQHNEEQNILTQHSNGGSGYVYATSDPKVSQRDFNSLEKIGKRCS